MTNYIIFAHRLDLVASGPTTSILGLYDFLTVSERTILLTLVGTKIHRENQINLGAESFITKKGFSLKLFRVFWNLLSATNHNVVVLNGAWAPYNYFIVSICYFRSSEVVWFPRGCLMPLAINRGRYSLSKLLKQITLVTFESLIMRYSSRIIVTSEMELNSIPNKFSNKVIIRNNPVAVNRCQIERVESRNEDNYILFLGRIHPIKRIDKLIMAAIEHKFKLIIAGPDFNHYWEKLNESFGIDGLANITYVGPVYDESKSDLIEGARYLALVSDSENFGNVVLESLGHGTPVIISEGVPWTTDETTIFSWETFEFTKRLHSRKSSDIIKLCHQRYLDRSFELW